MNQWDRFSIPFEWRLEHSFGMQNSALHWFRSYLSDRKQLVIVNGLRSSETPLDFGVPQGSVLGPVLFILYTTPLTQLIDSHSVRHEIYADDTQLNHSDSLSNYDSLIHSLQDCVTDGSLSLRELSIKSLASAFKFSQVQPRSISHNS